MKFVVRYFSEIALKSKPVRRQMVARLADNLRSVLRDIDPEIKVIKGWDKLQVVTTSTGPEVLNRLRQALQTTSGIAHSLEVQEHPLSDIESITQHALAVYGEALRGKTFAVRCKRIGKHDFSSIEVERQVGGALLARTEAAGVKLKQPDITVGIEITDNTLHIISQRYQGLGATP